jgi:hypothetical protein
MRRGAGAPIRKELTEDQLQALLLEVLPRPTKRKRVPIEALERAAIRALISPDFRNPERVRLLSQGRGNVLIRKLEELDNLTDALHALVERSAVERALMSSFGTDIATVWGGSRSIAIDGRTNDATPTGG